MSKDHGKFAVAWKVLFVLAYVYVELRQGNGFKE